MHELPIIKKVLDTCLIHAKQNQVKQILAIELIVGEMSDLEPEWMQKYFKFVAKGTLAEAATLKIEKIPVAFQCDACSHSFQVNIRDEQKIRCPECGGQKLKMVSGKEYYIKNMEVI